MRLLLPELVVMGVWSGGLSCLQHGGDVLEQCHVGLGRRHGHHLITPHCSLALLLPGLLLPALSPDRQERNEHNAQFSTIPCVETQTQ